MIAEQQPSDVPIIPIRHGGVTALRAQAFLAILVGLALRLLFVLRYPASSGDGEIYLRLARNWTDYHVYGLWVNGQLVQTDLRMPGYPAFLAAVAMVLGRSVRAIMLSQMVLDLVTCVLAAALCAALAPLASGRRVAVAVLWLAATCPFAANYSAVVLTEVLATFLTTAALVCFAVGLSREFQESSRHFLALLGALLAGIATLVRPEMPLLFAVAVVVFGLRWWRLLQLRKLVLVVVTMAGAFLLPLAPWAARNFMTLHESQILAPRYATMRGEYAPVGYYKWNATWVERYRDVYLNVWKLGEEPILLEDLPAAAFDSPQEKARIAELLEQYNNSPTLDISPELDREFAEIARERATRHPLRTYLWVPIQRALSIWFTPRTELLPIDGKFWPVRARWQDSHWDVLITAGFAVLGYLYIALALGGIWAAWRTAQNANAWDLPNGPNLWGIALILAYLVVRTAFLTTVESPEPRYVITCYPTVLALAGLLWIRKEKLA